MRSTPNVFFALLVTHNGQQLWSGPHMSYERAENSLTLVLDKTGGFGITKGKLQ